MPTRPAIPRSLQEYIDAHDTDHMAVEAWGSVVDIREIIRRQSIGTVSGFFYRHYWKGFTSDFPSLNDIPPSYKGTPAQRALLAACRMAVNVLLEKPPEYFATRSPRQILLEYTFDPDEKCLTDKDVECISEKDFEYWRHIHESNQEWRASGDSLGRPFYEATLRQFSMEDPATLSESERREVGMKVCELEQVVCEEAVRQLLASTFQSTDICTRDRILDQINHLIVDASFALKELIENELSPE